MKVIITRGFCAGNGKDVYPGDEIEMPEKEALLKIKQGKARDVNAPAKGYIRTDPRLEHSGTSKVKENYRKGGYKDADS